MTVLSPAIHCPCTDVILHYVSGWTALPPPLLQLQVFGKQMLLESNEKDTELIHKGHSSCTVSWWHAVLKKKQFLQVTDYSRISTQQRLMIRWKMAGLPPLPSLWFFLRSDFQDREFSPFLGELPWFLGVLPGNALCSITWHLSSNFLVICNNSLPYSQHLLQRHSFLLQTPFSSYSLTRSP